MPVSARQDLKAYTVRRVSSSCQLSLAMIDSIQSWCGVGLYALHIIFLILILNLNAEILCGENPCLNNGTCFSTPNTASCRCTKGMFMVHCPPIGKITLIGTIYHNLFTKC